MNPSYPSSPLSPTQQRMQQLPFYPNPRLQSPNANTPPNRGPISPPITPGRLDLSTSPINGSSSPASSMDNRKVWKFIKVQFLLKYANQIVISRCEDEQEALKVAHFKSKGQTRPL